MCLVYSDEPKQPLLWGDPFPQNGGRAREFCTNRSNELRIIMHQQLPAGQDALRLPLLDGRARALIAVGVLALVVTAQALDRVEVRPNGTSMSGRMSGATDFQFGVHVTGPLDQQIEQLERELRLLRFSRDNFPSLQEKVSFAGTNRLMS